MYSYPSQCPTIIEKQTLALITAYDITIKRCFLIPKQYIGNLGISGKIKATPQALANAIHPKRSFNTLNDTCSSIFHYYN